MKIAAVISEYNPYHNGHSYLINEARKVASFDACISVMSGNFVQRGGCAIYNKYLRAKLAALNEIDIVFELPVCYSTGSASDFALGAVSLLDKLGSVDYLVFGAEDIDSDLIHELTDILIQEPNTYVEQLKMQLRDGLSFASARQIALEYVTGKQLSNILGKPNNILAIEYFLALKKLNSRIKPVVIKRSSDNYHSENITGTISSATAIRNIICNQPDYINDYSITNCISNATVNEIKENNLAKPIFENDISSLLRSKLINTSLDSLLDICDCTNELAHRLINVIYENPYVDYNELVKSLESKNIATSRIQRVLTHFLLDYKDSHRNAFFKDGSISYYANILALNKNNTIVLKELSKTSIIPIISKKADFNDIIDNYDSFNEADIILAKTMWDFDMYATKLYNLIFFEKYNEILPNDYKYKFYI